MKVMEKTMSAPISVPRTKGTTRRIYEFLIANMNPHKAIIVSGSTLEELLKISTASVHRGIKALLDNGYISRYTYGGAYIFADPDFCPEWTDNGRGFMISRFEAVYIIARTEQNKDDTWKGSTPFLKGNTAVIISLNEQKEYRDAAA